MPITASYLFIVSMDIDPDMEDFFNEVYDTEHVPNILKVPGVVSATRMTLEPRTAGESGQQRLITPEGEPYYSVIYEIESPDILASEAWAEEAEKGRWPTEVRPHAKNRRHVLRKVMKA